MIRVRVYEPTGAVRDGDEALLAAEGLKWIDVQAPDEALLGRLADRFSLHRLEVEDCLHLDQRPKLEEYPGHHFIVLQGFDMLGDDCDSLEMHELHLMLGPDWLISVHEKAAVAVEAVHRRVSAEPKASFGKGVDHLAYLLADALADRSFPLLERLSDEIEKLEERIFTEPPSAQLMRRAFELKRILVHLRRILSPQRDVVGLLARPGLPMVQERTTLYFRDVYDHLIRIAEQIESGRDLVGNAVDAYLSVMANRTSDISKQLTIFASIFMPLSFIVGFFGQNFELLNRPFLFWSMLAAIVAIPALMLRWFRRRDWL